MGPKSVLWAHLLMQSKFWLGAKLVHVFAPNGTEICFLSILTNAVNVLIRSKIGPCFCTKWDRNLFCEHTYRGPLCQLVRGVCFFGELLGFTTKTPKVYYKCKNANIFSNRNGKMFSNIHNDHAWRCYIFATWKTGAQSLGIL